MLLSFYRCFKSEPKSFPISEDGSYLLSVTSATWPVVSLSTEPDYSSESTEAELEAIPFTVIRTVKALATSPSGLFRFTLIECSPIMLEVVAPSAMTSCFSASSKVAKEDALPRVTPRVRVMPS